MVEASKEESEKLIYSLDERPSFGKALFAAVQHLLAIFIPIITPPLLIASALQLDPSLKRELVSMALFTSGIGTLIQVTRIGAVGSGLLSIQGTSFSFVSTLIKVGGEGGLPLIFGTALAGSTIEMVLSNFLFTLRRVITPLVSGIVVTMIGLSLVKVGVINCGGGYSAMAKEEFGNWKAVTTSLSVVFAIALLNSCRRPIARMSSVAVGMGVGLLYSLAIGEIDFASYEKGEMISLPIPLHYGLSFSLKAFIPVAFIYLITIIEAVGDLTATSLVSNQPVKGALYEKRVRGGVLGDGVNSFIAALFNALPNTTFSQNNGIIRLTGIASRYVGIYIASLLILLGLFPSIGAIFSLLPDPVLGGGTLLMFGMTAASGIKIIASTDIDRRASLIVALSFAFGVGVETVPTILQSAPETIKDIFNSGITCGGAAAIALNLLLPEKEV